MQTEKTKILYLITQSNFGGAQKYVFDLATNLDKKRYDVAVGAGDGNDLLKKLYATGIKTFGIKNLGRAIRPFRDLAAYFEIKKLLKELKPDILHLNSSKAAVLGSLAARNLPIKVIYTVHGAVFEASFSILAKKIFLWAEKMTAGYKHRIICASERDRQLWLKNSITPSEKLITVHNGVNLNIEFLPKDEAREKLFENINPPRPPFKKGGEKETYLIGSTGYFYPEKNYSALIKAAELIVKLPASGQKKNILFLINGDGHQRPMLESLIKERGLQNHFFLPGAISPGSKYLKAFDIFVLPSVKEGLPYTILETMAAGVPIIAANVGGIPEMIKDGENGFLVKPNDYETLAEKILQILEDQKLAQKFINASLEKIKEFSLEKMVSKTEQQYKNL